MIVQAKSIRKFSFNTIQRYGQYPSAEMQSVYSAIPTDWVKIYFSIFNTFYGKFFSSFSYHFETLFFF